MARVVFLGTPAFAVPSLEALIELRQRGAIELAAVVTRPDRPGHRRQLQAPPTKEVATAAGLEVFQPERISGDAVERILALEPDALVWAAYGALIPRRLLEQVEGAVNVHPSLLPRWRGAEPVAHAILAGDRETGVTLMEGTAALDAGPVIAQERVEIEDDETTGELEARLARVGASLLERELVPYLKRERPARPQDEGKVTWAPKLDAALGALDFSRSAAELARIVRAYTPDPGAFTTFRGARVVVLRATPSIRGASDPGAVAIEGGLPHVSTAEGALRLDEVKPSGKRAMSGADWARGQRELAGGRLPS